MDELEVFTKLKEINAVSQYAELFGEDSDKARQIAAHILRKKVLQFTAKP